MLMHNLFAAVPYMTHVHLVTFDNPHLYVMYKVSAAIVTIAQ